MKLILLGAPGAGKGTQADILSRKLSIPTISTGKILRAAVSNGTPIGMKAKTLMDAGQLVPDDTVIGIVRERLREPDCVNGYILDGMPRTIFQADALEDAGIGIDVALEIEADDAEIEARITGRRTCTKCEASYHIKTNPPKTENVCDVCGSALFIRMDDQPETVKNRLKAYHQQTEPLIEYYKAKGKLKTVKNMSIEATTAAIMDALRI
jgi:adenylate kinase